MLPFHFSLQTPQSYCKVELQSTHTDPSRLPAIFRSRLTDSGSNKSQGDAELSIHPGNEQKWEASRLVQCPFRFVISCLRELGELATTPCQEGFASANPGADSAKPRPPDVSQKYYCHMKSTRLDHGCQEQGLKSMQAGLVLVPLCSYRRREAASPKKETENLDS